MSDSTTNPVPPVSPVTPSNSRSAMVTVFLVVFIDLLGFGIVLPLLPRVAENYLPEMTFVNAQGITEVNPNGMSDTARGAMLGALYSSFSLMQFVFSPFWGRLSDRIGRRPVLLISLTGSVVFYALFAYASSIPAEQSTLALTLLMLSRIGAGIAGASVSTAAAVIADCTTPEKRSRGMALIGVAFGFGFTLGPLIAYAGLKAFQDQHWGVGAVASMLSLVALIIAAVKFKETRKANGDTRARELFSLNKTIEIVRSPKFGPIVLAYFLVIFSFALFEGTLSLFTKDVFAMNDEANFLIFAFIGFVLMVAQGGVYRRVAGKIREEKLIVFGVIMLIVGMAGIAGVALAKSIMTGSPDAIYGLKPVFFLVTAIAVFGFAFVNPSISSLVSKRADPARQGEVQGVNQSFASLGRIFGPAIGLFVFEKDPRRLAPYALGILTLFLVGLLIPQINKTKD